MKWVRERSEDIEWDYSMSISSSRMLPILANLLDYIYANFIYKFFRTDYLETCDEDVLR